MYIEYKLTTPCKFLNPDDVADFIDNLISRYFKDSTPIVVSDDYSTISTTDRFSSCYADSSNTFMCQIDMNYSGVDTYTSEDAFIRDNSELFAEFVIQVVNALNEFMWGIDVFAMLPNANVYFNSDNGGSIFVEVYSQQNSLELDWSAPSAVFAEPIDDSLGDIYYTFVNTK